MDEAGPATPEPATPRNTLFPPPRPHSFCVEKGAIKNAETGAYFLPSYGPANLTWTGAVWCSSVPQAASALDLQDRRAGKAL